MDDDKILMDIWKTTVEVQQHFNTLELQIRNYAVTLTAALLALGGYTIKETSVFTIFGITVSISSLIVLASIVPISAFYFMDKYWYHRLLEGSVKAGAQAEAALRAKGYSVALGSEISASSPVINPLYGVRVGEKNRLSFPKRRMHSKHKMDVFYGILVLSLFFMSVLLSVGKEPVPEDRGVHKVPAPAAHEQESPRSSNPPTRG